MAAAQPPSAQGAPKQACIPCPDPSAHYKNTSLQEQASTAALYVTNPARSSSSPRDVHSDPKLSSAGAAASLKYARPQDLPSFPVIGIDPHASGLTAATLATANPKSIDWWKPSQSESAGRAALLAQDYKMSPSWQPEASAAGSKAALLAHKEGAKTTPPTKAVASKTGNTAAGMALKNKGHNPLSDHGRADDDHKRALIAATGAFSGSRRRAESTPTPIASFPDASNSKRNALNAATIAHRPRKKSVDAAATSSPALDPARVHNIARNVAREMYTDAPPVDIEVEEKKHQDALRASAISMARQMYSIQQAHINEVTASLGGAPAPAAAVMAHNDHGQSSQPSVSSEDDLRQQAMQYISLQEAAQKMAAERLAKIKTDDAAAFRDYYGYSKKQPRRRLSVKLTRRRASSEGEMLDSDDEERSKRIRKQMSAFNNRLAEVDAKKRQKDREALLAVAQKKVEAQMHDMDEKMFIETGKAPPAILEEWEAKARARAVAASDSRMVNHGKVHVGGGKYLDQAEIDAVAAARIQPTLKEINEKAEEQRARDEELRLDQEEKKRQARLEKEREAESKALERRLKSEEKQATKARKAEKKAAARAERNAETAKHAEETKIKKEEKLKAIEADQISSPGPAPSTDPDFKSNLESPTEPPNLDSKETRPQSSASSSSNTTDRQQDTQSGNQPQKNTDTDNMKHSTQDPMASPPLSPTSKSEKRSLRSFLNKFKRRSKHQDASGEASSSKRSSFVGGHALTGARPESHHAHHRHSSPPTIGRPTSFVRVAGANPYVIRATTSPSVSSLSSDDWEVHRTGRPTFNRTTSGLSRSGISDDEFDESRDAFDERLAPPPKFMASEGRVSPVRETIFREEL